MIVNGIATKLFNKCVKEKDAITKEEIDALDNIEVSPDIENGAAAGETITIEEIDNILNN